MPKKDVILDAIVDAYVFSGREKSAHDEEDRSAKEHAELVTSLCRQEADDAHRWKQWEKLHGDCGFAESKPERFPDGHAYAGFAKVTNTEPSNLIGQKCSDEGESYRKTRDAWIVRTIGPLRERRMKKNSNRHD